MPPNQLEKYKVTLVGCGKMGGALLRSWLDDDLIREICVIDPHRPDLADDARVTHMTQAPPSLQGFDDIIIIAVKPQILRETCEAIASSISAQSVVLSIAAGQNLTALESIFGSSASLIRCMPNTPAAIGKGMSVAIKNKNTSQAQAAIADALLSSAGITHWIEDENLMDAVTALSGSGPAYVFYMIESLAKAGEKIGLAPDMAMVLARQTVIGSAALAEHDAQTSAETLRKNVTSPNGTTQAGLEVLMDGRFDEILLETLKAAQKRSKELNG